MIQRRRVTRLVCIALLVTSTTRMVRADLYRIEEGMFWSCCSIAGPTSSGLPTPDQWFVELLPTDEMNSTTMRFLNAFQEPSSLWPVISTSVTFTDGQTDGNSILFFQDAESGRMDYRVTLDEMQMTVSGRFLARSGCADCYRDFSHFGVIGSLVEATVPGDLNGDAQLDWGDLELLESVLYQHGSAGLPDAVITWVEDLRRSWIGDSDLNGEFNSADLVAIFQVGEYEDAIANNSTWSEGDWNGDGDFDSSDLVLAFATGGFEQGPRPPLSTPGDFDNNGLLDLDDINLLLVEIASGHGEGFDLNKDGSVDDQDIAMWVGLKGTYLGDANLDGEFNSSDFVLIFQAGKYERDVETLWHEGDWNGDLRFNSADYVAAFHDYCFAGDCGQLGPPPISTVPEPAAGNLVWLVACLRNSRRVCVRR